MEPNLFIRAVALLLLPCLLADPTLAMTFHAPCPLAGSMTASLRLDIFQQEAMANRVVDQVNGGTDSLEPTIDKVMVIETVIEAVGRRPHARSQMSRRDLFSFLRQEPANEPPAWVGEALRTPLTDVDDIATHSPGTAVERLSDYLYHHAHNIPAAWDYIQAKLPQTQRRYFLRSVIGAAIHRVLGLGAIDPRSKVVGIDRPLRITQKEARGFYRVTGRSPITEMSELLGRAGFRRLPLARWRVDLPDPLQRGLDQFITDHPQYHQKRLENAFFNSLRGEVIGTIRTASGRTPFPGWSRHYDAQPDSMGTHALSNHPLAHGEPARESLAVHATNVIHHLNTSTVERILSFAEEDLANIGTGITHRGDLSTKPSAPEHQALEPEAQPTASFKMPDDLVANAPSGLAELRSAQPMGNGTGIESTVQRLADEFLRGHAEAGDRLRNDFNYQVFLINPGLDLQFGPNQPGRVAIETLAQQQGFDHSDIWFDSAGENIAREDRAMGLLAQEMEKNFVHAQAPGLILIRAIPGGLEIIARDLGIGIDNIPQALTPGYTTSLPPNKTPGLGLAHIKIGATDNRRGWLIMESGEKRYVDGPSGSQLDSIEPIEGTLVYVRRMAPAISKPPADPAAPLAPGSENEPEAARQVLRNELAKVSPKTRVPRLRPFVLDRLLLCSSPVSAAKVSEVLETAFEGTSFTMDLFSARQIALAINRAKDDLATLEEDLTFTPNDLQRRLIEHLQHAMKEARFPEDAKVIVYGSWADGRNRPGSDLDLFFDFDGMILTHQMEFLRWTDQIYGYRMDQMWEKRSLRDTAVFLKVAGARQRRLLAISRDGYHSWILSSETLEQEKRKLERWSMQGRRIEGWKKEKTLEPTVFSGVLQAVVETTTGSLELVVSECENIAFDVVKTIRTVGWFSPRSGTERWPRHANRWTAERPGRLGDLNILLPGQQQLEDSYFAENSNGQFLAPTTWIFINGQAAATTSQDRAHWREIPVSAGDKIEFQQLSVAGANDSAANKRTILSPTDGLQALRRRVLEAIKTSENQGINNIWVLVDGQELGIGKSTFVKNMAKGLKVPGWSLVSHDADWNIHAIRDPHVIRVEQAWEYVGGEKHLREKEFRSPHIAVYLAATDLISNLPPRVREHADLLIDWHSTIRPTEEQLMRFWGSADSHSNKLFDSEKIWNEFSDWRVKQAGAYQGLGESLLSLAPHLKGSLILDLASSGNSQPSEGLLASGFAREAHMITNDTLFYEYLNDRTFPGGVLRLLYRDVLSIGQYYVPNTVGLVVINGLSFSGKGYVWSWADFIMAAASRAFALLQPGGFLFIRSMEHRSDDITIYLDHLQKMGYSVIFHSFHGELSLILAQRAA